MANTPVDDLIMSDSESLLHGNLVIDDDAGLVSCRPDAPLREIFYGHCSEEDVDRARAMLVGEPRAPVTTPASVSLEKSGRVPRFYVECAKDRAITISLQRMMQAGVGCKQVYSLDTDHSPFFSAPEALASILSQIAG